MDTQSAVEALARDAQYDLSCACGTSRNDDHRRRGAEGRWLYPVTVPGGGTGIMLKTLLTNSCTNDCRYCPLRQQRDYPRVAVAPEKLARFFMDLRTKRKLVGMFLSSGVLHSADHTMQRLIDTARILRKHHGFTGYIHIKIIPGASREAIREAFALSNAVSLNIETPGARHYSRLSAMKDYHSDIIEPMKYISELSRSTGKHQTTQFIVGASDETDREILAYLWRLYQGLGVYRIYFSSYQRGLGDPSIPGESETSDGEQRFVREHRLYQADYLVRSYGFTFDDFLFTDGSLSLEKDPKQLWADAHPEFFPVAVNSAGKTSLLRVPGIGPTLAARILKVRKEQTIRDLGEIRIPRHLAEKAGRYLRFN